MHANSLGEELKNISLKEHSKFLNLGRQFLEIVGQFSNPFGRMDWDAPFDEEGNFKIIEAVNIRLFNHVAAFMIKHLSMEGQELFGGIPPLGVELNVEEFVSKWKTYEEEFGTNKFIAQKLREVANLRGRNGEGRSKDAHLKGANLIENHSEQITSGSEALQIKGIGEKIAAKIDELLNTGKIKILEEERCVHKILNLFMTVWGARSYAIAQSWYDAGCRSIDDVRSCVMRNIIKPTKQQVMGLKYYEDFQIPLEAGAVKAVGSIVRMAANNLPGHRNTIIVGSYRRKVHDTVFDRKGSAEEILAFRTKDVDVLIVDDNKNKNTLGEIVKQLGMIATVEFASMGTHQCMGAIYVPSLGKFKRLDIFLCDTEELPCAILAHTGPADYNVRMRQEAKDRGWTLNEHHLYDSNDRVIPTDTEEDVQRLLGFPPQKPHERK